MVEIAIEGFLCQFVPLLYMFPAHEFDAACGPSAGIQDDELEHEALNNSRRSFEPLRPARKAMVKEAPDRVSGLDGSKVPGQCQRVLPKPVIEKLMEDRRDVR
ncbi:hypothetical protein EV363DRAFT_1457394 [Boletus edulis]|nr:hypothetical protein EV363DRAFT_1457394 [Boletus edulis]